MSWLTLIAAATAATLTWLDVQPVWIQMVAYATALALLLMQIPSMFSGLGSFKKWFQKRGLLILSLSFLLIGNLVSRQYDQVYDFSRTKIYSLRPQTISWIQKITEPVQIYIFLGSDDKSFAYAEWLQKQMDRYGKGIRVEIKNFNRDIAFTKLYGVNQSGETVLVSGDHWVKVGNFREDSLVQGFVRLMSKTTAVLCFLSGHGEADLEDARSEGLMGVKTFLASLGYKLKTVSLLEIATESVQKDCSLLAIISPKIQFFPREEESLLTLSKSLPLLIAAEPPVSAAVLKILRSMGLEPSDRPVIARDNPKKKFGLTDIFLRTHGEHFVTLDIEKEIFLPETQSFTSLDENWTPLLATPTQENYGELGVESSRGPYHLMMALEKMEGLRYLVLGSGKGFQNRYLQYGDTQKFLYNGIRWLLDEEGIPLVSIRAADEQYMTLSDQERFWVKAACFYLYPGLGFLVLFGIWGRRNLTS